MEFKPSIGEEGGSEENYDNVPADEGDISYSIGGKKQSLALIFNHIEFDDDKANREEAKADGERLQNVLTKFNFDVRYYQDLNKDELFAKIKEVKEAKEERDCLLVAVMTHGEDGGWLHAKDYQYKEEELWRNFEEVPSLTGKPKIFLFQCCRGDKMDCGSNLSVLSSQPPKKMEDLPVPKNADFFIVHSAPQGYESWKSSNGAWLIQDFCTQLEKNAANKDLAKIMTLVANSMSKRTSAAEKESRNSKKQVPVITSTLTKLMYFRKPNQ